MTEYIIRASMLDSYGDCPLRAAVHQWTNQFTQRGYTAKQVMPHIGAAVGTAVHAAINDAMNQKKVTGQEPNLSDAVDKGVASLAESTKDGVTTDSVTPDLGTGRTQIQRMTKAYYSTEGYKQHIEIAEKRFEVGLSSIKEGWKLSGAIDQLTISKRLDDFKTGKRLGIHPRQLGAYCIVLSAHKYDVVSANAIYMKRMPVSYEQERPVHTVYDPAVVKPLAVSQTKRIISDVEKFEAVGDASTFQVNPMSNMCSAKFCKAFGTDICSVWKFKKEG